MSESRRNGRAARPPKPANDMAADKAQRRAVREADRAAPEMQPSAPQKALRFPAD
jgi:hypothetical protein